MHCGRSTDPSTYECRIRAKMWIRIHQRRFVSILGTSCLFFLVAQYCHVLELSCKFQTVQHCESTGTLPANGSVFITAKLLFPCSYCSALVQVYECSLCALVHGMWLSNVHCHSLQQFLIVHSQSLSVRCLLTLLRGKGYCCITPNIVHSHHQFFLKTLSGCLSSHEFYQQATLMINKHMNFARSLSLLLFIDHMRCSRIMVRNIL